MIKKVLTIGIAALAATVPLTAHAETVDEANQATQTAYRAYQQAELEKTQAWNDSHGDIYSAWQTADAKAKALYSAYLDARQHAGLVSAEAKRNQSVSPNSDASESQSSSESQSLSEGQTPDTQSSKTQSSKVSTSDQPSSTSDQPFITSDQSSINSNANLTNVASDAIPTAHSSANQTSNTLPQTGDNKKNGTVLALGGVMSIATAAMSVRRLMIDARERD